MNIFQEDIDLKSKEEIKSYRNLNKEDKRSEIEPENGVIPKK